MNQMMTHPDTLPAFIFGQDLEEKPFFEIDSEDKASWAANKILAAEHRMTLRQELAERYKARVDAWLDQANKPDQDSIESLRGMLQYWLSKVLKPHSRTRSIKVLGASIGFRKRPDRVEIQDPALAIQFCEERYPIAVMVKKDLSKTLLKAYLTNGKDIPGTTLALGEDELTVKES